MDLEGFARRALAKGEERAKAEAGMARLIAAIKGIDRARASAIAAAVFDEVVLSNKKPRSSWLARLLSCPRSGVSMGAMGVGSRGTGDFFVHRLLAGFASGKTALGPGALDDAGAVKAGRNTIVVSVDGTHSRLSEWPFLAGFHVTRAALRDVLVKGARPVALFTDLHLADDGDVGKLFDFSAGIGTVSELTGVPLVAGSTLRVGGDMVIGDRMVSCVGAVGVAGRNLFARANVKPGDAIVMTEGAGGGTVCTAAIFSGHHDVVAKTLNINFIRACRALAGCPGIHAMLDVTNGGLRGDAAEVCRASGVGLMLEEKQVREMVNARVLALLEEQGIDYLGVSLDSLLAFTRKPELALERLKRAGVKAAVVGKAAGKECRLLLDGRAVPLLPRFRESAYTKIKKLAGEEEPGEKSAMEARVLRAAEEARRKMREAVKFVRKSG
ncbi:MAG: AIR synthase-related protein [Candidatus Micrarchaeia archaeon]